MTRTIRCLAVLVTMLNVTAYAQGAPTAASVNAAADGTIVSDEACSIKLTGNYEEYKKLRAEFYLEEVKLAKAEGITMTQVSDLAPYTMTREAFEKRMAWEGTECHRITYMSDGLKVKGFIWKPKDSQGKKLPLIIYNRGGALDFGKLHAWALGGFHFWVSRGFAVIATQYRGNDGGEGKEEFGGADLNDVMSLFPLAKSLGYIDMDNVYMLGASRGGMMTYLALRKGAPVKAAVVTAGMVDLEHLEKVRPGFERTVYSVLIPGYKNDPQATLRERSAVHWADKINTPLMILHGGADWRVPPTQALALAQKLQERGKTYSLHIYEGDDHMFTLNALDSDQRALAWFRRHMN